MYYTFVGLLGKNDIEEAKIHMICHCMSDTMKTLYSIVFESDETRKVGIDQVL